VQLGDRTVGLLVDVAREVVMLDESQVQPPPRIVSEGASGFVRGVAHEGKRMLMLVDSAKVIGEEPIHVP
jgi:purine-binding chemotaxis protein CheW